MRLRPALAILALCLAAPPLTAAPAPAPPAEDAALRRARALLKRVILLDGHNDLPWAIREWEKSPGDVEAYDLRRRTDGETDIPRIREGGLGAQFWSVYVPTDVGSGFTRYQMEQIDILHRIVALYPDTFALAFTADDVVREFRRGRVASLIGMEGGHVLENSLGALRSFHALGARYMTLTHSKTLDWADAAGDKPRHGGLTRFGEEVVREMNRLGMLVDLSHVTPDTMDDALRVSEAPVIFSHSSARALCDVERNVPDAILTKVKANGGVVMVTFVGGFISQEYADKAKPIRAEHERLTLGMTDAVRKQKMLREMLKAGNMPKVTIAQVADHIAHIRTVAGVDHVGLGGDFDGATSWPEGLEDVSMYPNLFAELVRRGWTDAELEKLAGANVLRALRGAEETSRRLRARPPSKATIESLDGKPPAPAPAS